MLPTFDPAMVIISWGGVRLIGPFAAGTFVKIAQASDLFTKKVGSTGEGSRARMRDSSGTVEVTLDQGSLSNDVLSTAANVDVLTGIGGVKPLHIEDLSGTSIFDSPAAWIKKLPDQEFSNEMSDRVWIFEYITSSMNVGSNLPAIP